MIVISCNERWGESVEFNPIDFSQWIRPSKRVPWINLHRFCFRKGGDVDADVWLNEVSHDLRLPFISPSFFFRIGCDARWLALNANAARHPRAAPKLAPLIWRIPSPDVNKTQSRPWIISRLVAPDRSGRQQQGEMKIIRSNAKINHISAAQKLGSWRQPESSFCNLIRGYKPHHKRQGRARRLLCGALSVIPWNYALSTGGCTKHQALFD